MPFDMNFMSCYEIIILQTGDKFPLDEDNFEHSLADFTVNDMIL